MTRARIGGMVTGMAGMAMGVAVAIFGVPSSFGDDLPSGQALVELREKGLKAAGGAMQFLSQYDGSDATMAAKAAKAIDDAASGLTVWFPEGSGPGGAGIEKTRAKAEIWANLPDFETKIKGLDDASGLLTNAVATNDPAAIKVAVGDVGKACKACHEVYRGPEE